MLTGIRDEIKAGNLTVRGSKRFGDFDHFFMPFSQWEKERSVFFKRAGLPEHHQKIKAYLTERLNQAFDRFLATESCNTYAQIKDGKWVLSVDPAENLSTEEDKSLESLKVWINKHMRPIKLPQLLT